MSRLGSLVSSGFSTSRTAGPTTFFSFGRTSNWTRTKWSCSTLGMSTASRLTSWISCNTTANTWTYDAATGDVLHCVRRTGSQSCSIEISGYGELSLDDHSEVVTGIWRGDGQDVEGQVVALVEHRRGPDGGADALAGGVVLGHHRLERLILSVDADHTDVLLVRAAGIEEDEAAGHKAEPVRAVGGGLNGLRIGPGGYCRDQHQAVVGVRQAARGGQAVTLVVHQEVIGRLVGVRQRLRDAHELERFPRRAAISADLHQERRLSIRRAPLEIGVDAADRRGVLHLHRDDDVFLNGERD